MPRSTSSCAPSWASPKAPDSGPIFETLPWTAATRSGQDVLVEKQPEADAVLAVLRGEAPIPTATTAAPATTSGGGGSTPAVRPVDVRVVVRNGSGVQGAAGTTAQDLQQKGFVNGGAENDPRGTVDHSEIRYARPTRPRRSWCRASCPARSSCADATLSGTDIVLVLGKDFHGLGTTATTGPAGDDHHRVARSGVRLTPGGTEHMSGPAANAGSSRTTLPRRCGGAASGAVC